MDLLEPFTILYGIFPLMLFFVFVFLIQNEKLWGFWQEKRPLITLTGGYGERRLPIAASPQSSGFPRSVTASAVQPIRPPFSNCKSASALSSFNTKYGYLSNTSGNIWFLRRGRDGGSCRETSAVHQNYWAAIVRPKINQPSSRYDWTQLSQRRAM